MTQVLDDWADLSFSDISFPNRQPKNPWQQPITGPTGTGTTGGVVASTYKTIWISAHEMMTTTTNGAAADAREYATNDVNRTAFAFDTSTDEHINISLVLPWGWTTGPLRIKLYWAGASGCSAADTVVWKVRATAKGDDDAIDATTGTTITVNDTVTADGDQQITDWSGLISVGGTPVAGAVIDIDIWRDNGTMAEDALLHGIMIMYPEADSVFYLDDIQGLYAWGQSTYGVLGISGASGNYTSPTQVDQNFGWSDQLSAGYYATMAIKQDGSLWGWGRNHTGNLGLGDKVQRDTPTRVGTGYDWSQIKLGNNHSVAIKTDGTLWSWGYNGNGQLGHGSTTEALTPVQVGSADNWTSIAAAVSHTLAINSAGELWACGYNGSGEVGDGSTTQRTSLVQIGALTTWAKIAAGGFFGGCSFAIKTDGTLWSWGENGNGQLGQGDTTDLDEPTQVGVATNWDEITSGNGNFAIALQTDGTLWSWGANGNGQLGDGSTTERTSPVQIGALTTWAKIAAGGLTGHAIKTDGTLWGWGYNTVGTVGDGSTTQRTSPVQVGTRVGWQSVHGGAYQGLCNYAINN